MIVGFDAHTVGHRHTGNETYAVCLLRALRDLDTDDRFRVYLTPEGQAADTWGESESFSYARVPTRAWLRFSISMPLAVARHPVDLLHVQYAAPWGIRCKLVTTIHDISYIHLPQQLGMLDRLRVERLFPATARRSELIITGSQATKDDLIEHFKIAEDRIVVTPYGVSSTFRHFADRTEVERVLGGLGLEPGYILYVGALQPRKNLPRLLKAFDLLKSSEKMTEKLVIVGKWAWQYQDILDTHASLKSRDDVIFMDYVPDATLPYLYNGAKVFVYPSLYEGFGLPPLEAMACGVPVAVSNVSAMPEVVGKAGVYFDPLSVESISEATHGLLKNDRLRQALKKSGMERAAQYNWRETAVRTLEVYRSAVQ